MVDIVTQTMPAESEVHVARNFLTKILRSSMRYCGAVGLCLVTPSPVRSCSYHPSTRPPLPDPSITSSAMWRLSCSCAVHVQDGDYTLKLIIGLSISLACLEPVSVSAESSVFPAVLLMSADHLSKTFEQMF